MGTGGRLQRRLENGIQSGISGRVATRHRSESVRVARDNRTAQRAATIDPRGQRTRGRCLLAGLQTRPPRRLVKNLAANPRVRVKLGRRWYAGTATIVDSEAAQTGRRRVDEGNGMGGWIDGVIFRARPAPQSQSDRSGSRIGREYERIGYEGLPVETGSRECRLFCLPGWSYLQGRCYARCRDQRARHPGPGAADVAPAARSPVMSITDHLFGNRGTALRDPFAAPNVFHFGASLSSSARR